VSPSSPTATRRSFALALVALSCVTACRSRFYIDGCERARDHLIDLRFAQVAHEPAKLWQLLLDFGGAENVDRRALQAALARPHDEHWFDPLRDRQRYSPQMRTWLQTCVGRLSNDHAACIANATSLEQVARCDD